MRERRSLVLPREPYEDLAPERGTLALVSAEGRLGLRATVVPLDPDGAPRVSADCRLALGAEAGDEILVTPLP